MTVQQCSAQLRFARLSYNMNNAWQLKTGAPRRARLFLLHVAIHTFRRSLLFAYFSSILMIYTALWQRCEACVCALRMPSFTLCRMADFAYACKYVCTYVATQPKIRLYTYMCYMLLQCSSLAIHIHVRKLLIDVCVCTYVGTECMCMYVHNMVVCIVWYQCVHTYVRTLVPGYHSPFIPPSKSTPLWQFTS